VKDFLKRLQETSDFDYLGYVERYNAFFSGTGYIALVEYWNKRNSDVPIAEAQEFDWLYDQYSFLVDELHRQVSLQTVARISAFELFEYFADIKLSLDSTRNLPKYLRASSNFVDVFDIPVEEYFVLQGDTLESIALKFYGVAERYTDIADYNEIMYYNVNDASWVGSLIKVPLVLEKEQVRIPGIVDGQVGKNILGKDIKCVFAYADSDIETVEHEDCFVQSMYTLLAETPRGSLPEIPTLGCSVSSIIGKNVGVLSTSLIIADLQSLFKVDPTFLSMRVTNVSYEEGTLNIKIEFSSVFKNVKHTDSLSNVFRT
jgi:hypothetical protein